MQAFQPRETKVAPVKPNLPRHTAKELTGDGDIALIELNDQVYTLRITRQKKLILTK
ncbi:MAG: hemin uptake protein HemP [Pseudomonadota bacterium]